MPSKTILLQALLLLGSSQAIGSVVAQLEAAQQPLHDASSSPADDAPSYRDDLIALHKHLVEIPSTTGTESDAGDFLVDYFISQSWNYETQPVAARDNTPPGKQRFNVLAWPPSSAPASQKPAPKVLVTSHIDCVPPHIPYSIHQPPSANSSSSTVIAGRCSVDAKGSVAAQIIAVRELLAARALDPADVLLLYVVGEERGGDGMRTFNNNSASRRRLRAAVFGEPTENKLACGHKGAMLCHVTATGRAGHSGYPWLGKSATELLMRALVRVLDADLGSSARYGNTTVNVGLVAGGVALNVIPAHADAWLMCRIALAPQQTGHLAVVQRMEEILAGVDDEALRLECASGKGVTPCDCDVDGFDTIVANYGTDIPYLDGDHARYLYGPGSILVAHGDDEALTVADLETAVEGFKKLILHGLKQ